MRDPITLHLPYPPSVNTYWRHARGRHYITQKGVDYRLAVRKEIEALGVEPITYPVRVEIYVTRPDKRRRDLDNVLKCPIDAIVKQGLLADDDAEHIKVLAVRDLGVVPKHGGLQIVISEYLQTR